MTTPTPHEAEQSGEQNMSHTKEPWYVGAQNDQLYITAGRPPAINNDYPVPEADRTRIAQLFGEYAICSANAKRIVACVNALAGISTAELEEQVSHGKLIALSECNACSQRDKLFEVLKYYLESWDKGEGIWLANCYEVEERARNVIAEIEATEYCPSNDASQATITDLTRKLEVAVKGLEYALEDEPNLIPRASSSCRDVIRQALALIKETT